MFHFIRYIYQSYMKISTNTKLDLFKEIAIGFNHSL